jgi:spore coat protein U-like protein
MLVVPAAAHAACSVSASGVAFGVYNPLSSSPTNFSGSVTFTCTAGSGTGPYTIALSAGGGGSFAGRKMSNGVNGMAYQLYLDAGDTRIWGDGTGGSSIFTGTDNVPVSGGGYAITVYGQIPARLAVSPGTYTDMIIVTISY